MIKNFFRIAILLAIMTLAYCDDNANDKPEDIIAETEEPKPSIEQSKFNAQNVFNSLPDHKVVLKLIEDNKIEYNPDILNDPNFVSKYSTEFSKGINLGIYGSDLNIASSFDQTQESMVFLKCVNMLASNLGVSSAFDQKMFERIEANSTHKDSVLEIVTNAFKKVDEILKYNNRPATSAIILSGCWIEGLFVSCKIAEEGNHESIIKTIIAQKESLRNLIIMIKSVNLEEKDKFIIEDMDDLYKAFEVAETTKKYNLKSLSEISRKIALIRSKITAVS